MPSLPASKISPRHPGADSPSERYTRALVRLTQAVWQPDCSFDTAVGLICATAADALQVERVNAWHYDEQQEALRCVHSYIHGEDRHERADVAEVLPLAGDYAQALHEVRAIDAADVEADASDAAFMGALRQYLRRHRIQALLDAPVRIEGKLLGVICHESVDRRQWTAEEATFAASMGDYLAMAHQIERRRSAEKQIRHLRLHDATTDLPNRDYMIELIGQRLVAPRPGGHAAAVVHVRIDAAHVTDLSGGATTLEDVMAQVALRLRAFIGTQLSLARVRADAFAFLAARGATEADAVRLAHRCIAAVRAMPWEREEIEPGAAIGIAFAEAGESDARVLLRKAEQAADHAREQGRHRFEVFDIDRHDELVARLRMERALGEAFAGGDLEVHYQPEYDLRRAGWSGAEALLRWRSDAGLVAAAEFMPIVEASELMLPLGSWVLRQACHDAMAWVGPGTPPVVRVNVSARQLDEDGLADEVAAALASARLPPERLCLEITETTLMGDIERTLPMLHRLKALGVKIAIDDFGTGYASLTYLKRFPIDTIKIDGSFVQDLPRDATDAAIVSAVFGLAQSLRIEVVAEGVERLEQQQALQDIGVTHVQGWLYAQAMEQTKVRALFAASAG